MTPTLGWESARLDEVAQVQLGRQRSPKNHFGERMRPYVRAANLTWTGLVLDDVKEMNFTAAESSVYELRPGDVLVSEASGSPDEVGKPAIWRGEIDGCCFQNTVVRVRSRGVLSEYLRYFLLAEARSGRIGRASPGVGIHHIGAARLSAWGVPVPPLAEQRRIVAAIEEQFSRLDAAERSFMAALSRIAALTMAAYSKLDALHLDRDIAEIADVRGGIQKQPKRRPVANSYPFLRVANVLRGRLDLDEVHEVELFDGELDRYRLLLGDLLVVEGNGSREQIGRSAVWSDEIVNCVHQNHLIRVRPRQEIDPRYLGVYWNSPGCAERLAQVASTTSGLYTLSVSKLNALRIAVPPLDEQRRIVAELEQQLSLIDSLRTAVESAQKRSAALRRAILERAFRGELVPQDPGDEPASVLLERIRAERAAEPTSPKRRAVRSSR